MIGWAGACFSGFLGHVASARTNTDAGSSVSVYRSLTSSFNFLLSLLSLTSHTSLIRLALRVRHTRRWTWLLLLLYIANIYSSLISHN